MKCYVINQVQYDNLEQKLLRKNYQEEIHLRKLKNSNNFEYRRNVFSKKASNSEVAKKITKSILLIIVSFGGFFIFSSFRLSLKQAFMGKKVVIIKSEFVQRNRNTGFNHNAGHVPFARLIQIIQGQQFPNNFFQPIDTNNIVDYYSRCQSTRLSTIRFNCDRTETVSNDILEILNTQGIFILHEYAKKNKFISLNGVDYNIEYKDNCLIIKNNSDELIIPFTNNSQSPLKDSSINLKVTPHLNDIPLRDLIRIVYALTSKYTFNHLNNQTSISLVKEGLLVCPDYHLENLAQIIEKYPRANIRLKFFNHDLTENVGIDIQGLKKDYFNDLMKGLMSSRLAIFKKGADENLLLPQAKEELKKIEFDKDKNPIHPNNSLANLSKEEKKFYENLGLLLMYAYKNKINLGCYLDFSLFNMIFSLSSINIRDLDSRLLLLLCQKYSEDVKKSGYSDQLVKILDYLNKDEWTEEDCNLFGTIADGVNIVHPRYQTDGFFDYSKIINNKNFTNEMVVLLMNCFYKLTIRDVKFGNLIQPMLAIASGMHKFSSANSIDWDKVDAVHFQDIVQGSLDRKVIVNCFRIVKKTLNLNEDDIHIPVKWDENEILDPSICEIKKKVNWIRDWIINDAKDEEIRGFLKYITGTTSLSKDIVIKICFQAKRSDNTYSPAPLAHSCFNQIDISPEPCGVVSTDYNDHTKEKFIALLKEHCLKNDHYQFA